MLTAIRFIIRSLTQSSRAIALFVLALASLGAFSAHADVNMVASSFTSDANPVPGGATFTYAFVAYNGGTDPASNVTLFVPVESQFQYLSYSLNVPGTCSYSPAPSAVNCSLGTVAGDPTLSTPIRLNVTVQDLAPGPFVVSSTGTVATSTTETNYADDSQVLTTTVINGADLTITSSVAAPNPIPAGGNVTFTIVGANNGPNTALTESLVTTLPPGIAYVSASGSGWGCSASGQIVTCLRSGPDAIGALPAVSLVGQITSPTSGTLTASSTLSSSTTADGVPNNNTLTANVTVVPGTVLSIAGSESPNPAISGAAIVFTLDPRNVGPMTAPNLTVMTTLPGAYTNITASGSGWNCTVAGEKVTCVTPSYVVGAANNITINAISPSAPTTGLFQDMRVDIKSDLPDPVGNDTAYITYFIYPAQSDLAISKNKSPASVSIGGLMNSIIHVHNFGPSTALGPILMTDTLAPGEDYDSYDPIGSAWTCAYSAATRVVSCSYPQDLVNGGGTPNVIINTRAISSGSLTNRACTSTDAGWVGIDNVGGNNCTNATSQGTVLNADLSIVKTVSSPDLPATTQDLVYTLTVTNNGPGPASIVNISDDVSNSTGSGIAIANSTEVVATAGTPSLGSPAGVCQVVNDVITCSYPTLLANETVAVAVSLTRPMNAGTFTNTARTYSTLTGDLNTANNTAMVTSKVEAVADVAVTAKTVSPSTILAGTTTTYVISVQNFGPSAAQNVNVADVFTLPTGDAGFATVSSTATNGGACTQTGLTFTCTWATLNNQEAESATIVIQPNFEANPPAPRTYLNTATITSATYDPVASNNFKTATLFVNQAQLDALVLDTDIANPVAYQPAGTPITYKLTVTNNGPSLGTGFLITDSMSPPAATKSVTFLCDTANAGDPCPPTTSLCSGGTHPASGAAGSQGAGGATITTACNIQSGALPQGYLTTGSTFVRYLNFIVNGPSNPNGDVYVNTARLTSDEPDTNPANNVAVKNTTVLPTSDLETLSKAATPSTVFINQPFTWTIKVTNHGPSPSSAPHLTDNLPADMVLVSAPVVSSAGAVCTGTAGATSFVCVLSPLTVSEVQTITVQAKITAYHATISNTATLDTQGHEIDPNPNNNSATGTVAMLNNSIAGVVFQDNNTNGLFDAGDAGLSGLQFRLTGTDDYGDSVSLTATSDVNGAILFSNLSPSSSAIGGGYALAQVSVTPSGIADAQDAAGTLGGTAHPVGQNTISAIALPTSAAGLSGTGYLFPKQPTVGTLAGTVYVDLNGNGKLDASEPGAGSTTITITGTTSTGTGISRTTTSAADGSYSFSGLAATNAAGYTLTLTLPTGDVAGATTVGTNGGTAGAAPSTTITGIPLSAAGNGSGYNFGLISTNVSGLVYIDANRNGIDDPSELTKSGVTVELQTSTGTVVATTTSASNGTYHFTGINPGSYIVTIITPTGYGSPATVPVTVVAGATETANFGITVSSINGVVYFDANANGMQDAAETGVGNVTVSLSYLNLPGPLVTAITTTAANGSFSFKNLLAGSTYSLIVTQPAGYIPGAVITGSFHGTAAVTPAATTVSGIAVNAGMDSSTYYFSELGNAIHGVVFLDTNRDGTQETGELGVPGTTVTLKNSNGAVIATAITAGEGSYLFQNEPIGQYSVVESVPAGYGTSTATTVPVVVVAGAVPAVSFGLTNGSISGTVYNDLNNNGVQDPNEPGIGAVVVTLNGTVNGSSITQTTTSSANGSYSFTNLLAGTYSVMAAQVKDFAPGTDTPGSAGGTAGAAGSSSIVGIVVQGGTQAAGYLIAELGTSLSGTAYLDNNDNAALDAGEQGIAGVTITLYGTGNVVLATTVTDVNGHYNFPVVPTGSVTVTETQPVGYATSTPLSRTLTLAAGNTAPVVNFGSLPSSLSGFVFVDTNVNGAREAGEPALPQVTITLTGTDAAGNSVNVSTVSDTSGAFSFTALRGGTFLLTESQPSGYLHGTDTTGTSGGTGSVGKGTISAISLMGGVQATRYSFAEILQANSAISGSAWLDLNHDLSKDAGDPPVPGITVELLQGSNIVGTTLTAADGSYSFKNVTPGSGYTLRFRDSGSGALYALPEPNETGSAYQEGMISASNPGGASNTSATLAGETLLPGETLTGQSLPLAPTGIVYDAVSRQPVSGATVRLSGPAGFNAATELAGGAGNLVQTTGVSGLYQFYVLSGAPSGVYTLTVTAPANGKYSAAGTSVLIPPCAGPVNVSGSPNPFVIESNNAPPAVGASHSCQPGGNSTTYYLSFTLVPGRSAPIVNNDLPIDPVLSGALRVTKTTPLININAGQAVPYTITVTNTLSTPVTNASMVDTFPAGFQFRVGSALLNGAKATPIVIGRILSFTQLNFAVGETKTFNLVLTAGIGVTTGEYVNSAQATEGSAGTPVSNVATATVRIIPDPTFDCPDLIGKVFEDTNGNGYPDQGEKGIAGVRLVTAQGLLVTTDKFGRYHIACPVIPNSEIGSNFIVKLDEQTLPTGYKLTTENPMTVRLTEGKVSKLNFGASLMHTVKLEFSASAFDETKLRVRVAEEISKIALAQKSKPTVLHLVYVADTETDAVAEQHVKEMHQAALAAWKAGAGADPIRVEEEIVRTGRISTAGK